MMQGALVNRAQAWSAQQFFAAADYETGLLATIDWDLMAKQVRFITLAQNTTIRWPINPRRGGIYIMVMKQNATGGYTVSWSNQVSGGAGVWAWTAGGTAPTITTTAAKRDVATFIFDGTDMIGTITQNA